jgi:uncharacterized protein (TIGR02246 family)
MNTNSIIPIVLCAALLALGAVFSPARGQAEARKSRELTADERAIADKANAYVAAYNKGDAKALAALFAEDAEWIDENGGVLTGRPAIEAALKAALAGSKGRKVDIDVESVRTLTPDVLLEKGTTTVTEANGRNAVNSYTAVHVKKGNDWLISQLTETGAPLTGTGALRLRELEWMVGSWVDKTEGIEVKTKVDWTPNHTFLTRSFSVKREGSDPHSGTEVIGFDPVAGKVRSWVFESDGSFAENTWTADGTRWLITAKVTLPDGRQATAQHTVTVVDRNKYTWVSANRQIDGELLPNIGPVEIVRAK